MIIKLVGNKTDDIKKILNNENEFSKKFLSAKKPMVIIGESALELKVANIFLKN